MADATIDEGGLTPAHVGAGAAALTLVVFAYLTTTLFDDPTLGLIAGAFSGAGIYFLVPYTIRRGETGGATGDGETDDGDAVSRSFHPGAFGYAFSSAGVLLLALLFVFDDWLLPVAAPIAVAAAEYTVLSRVLPRAD